MDITACTEPQCLYKGAIYFTLIKNAGKSVPLQAWTGPKGSRKLRFPDYVTMAQNDGRLSALRTGCFYPPKYSCYSFLLETESAPGP